MPDTSSPVDGARVLADLNALRGIGAYKTGVHKPTFSEPHMRSLEWLAEKLPEAGLAATIDGIGNVLGTSAKAGPKLLAGSHLESQTAVPTRRFGPYPPRFTYKIRNSIICPCGLLICADLDPHPRPAFPS